MERLQQFTLSYEEPILATYLALESGRESGLRTPLTPKQTRHQALTGRSSDVPPYPSPIRNPQQLHVSTPTLDEAKAGAGLMHLDPAGLGSGR
ncbi:uncharacterized protein CLUP02_01996 [Colletotrichum lupini]|uniref:Uncharacterized protein n=1 Tax=Colletotrichum lupini TaxID=145971 RepID=A0A9Q8SDG7_9PEZI|nr:uncharacterized protein CLUP02_01996 [Colletotrichum lupini]UQC75342.1 hypothetical protein CLUP02_01996 [Colletotrichum lupini]